MSYKNVSSWKKWSFWSFRRLIWRIILYFLIISGLIIIMIPLAWQISTALKSPGVIFNYPPEWIPHPIMWHNFIDSLSVMPFAIFYKNTIIICSLVIIGHSLSCSLVAFSFARLKFPGRDILFLATLATMLLPSQVTIIPRFLIFRYLNWIDTLKPLIVPAFFGSAFYIFLLRQFFMTIPLDMDNAARIDGCSSWGIFWKMILPLSKPVLGVLAIFSFMGNWNDFMDPLIYLSSEENFTVALGLNAFKSLYNIQWNLLMAGSFISTLPCLAIFFFGQKYFIQGIVITGIKG